jgi:putative transcriptional regulator
MRPMKVAPMRPMTEEEVRAAPAFETDSDLRTVRRVLRVKTMRRALGLTQEQFAERYHIPTRPH